MAWNLVSSATIAAKIAPVTPAISCIGADLIVVETDAFATGTFSDSSSNTWNQIGPFLSGSAKFHSIFYAYSPVVSVAQTFTYSAGAGSVFAAINATAWSGSGGSGLVDQTTNAIAATTTSLAAGSITPSRNNALVIAGLGTDGGTAQTIGSGFTLQSSQVQNGATNEGAAIAYLIQGTAAAINPTWSWTTNANATAIIASFLPTAPPLGISKVHSIFNSTEITIQMPGLSTSQAILTDGLPFGTVELSQASGTSITSVQVQQSNDGVTWINQGSAVSVPAVQDLYTGTSPSKFIRFLVNGGDTTSVVNIMIELMGTRG